MKIIGCTQGSTAWSQARCGVVTASEVDSLITPLWKVRTGEGVESYMFRKLAEKSLGYALDTGSTFDMDMGQMAEKLALPWFNFMYDTEARRVGFCVSDCGRYGCSPDALIGDDSGLEIKFPTAPIHLRYLLANELPAEYAPQVHFSMFVTGRPSWNFLSFSRQFPSLVVHVERDEKIQSAIKSAVEAFYEKFDARMEQINALRQAENEQHERRA